MLFLAFAVAQEATGTGDGRAFINKSIHNDGRGGNLLSKSHLNSMSQPFLQLARRKA